MPMTWVRITALDCTKVWFTTGGSKVFGLVLLWRILTKYTSTITNDTYDTLSGTRTYEMMHTYWYLLPNA